MSTICDDLRAAILQAAMQGKLTKQLPEDGDAEELLSSVAEARKLAAKNAKASEQIDDIEKLFAIPDSWSWARVGDIFSHNTGKTKNASQNTSGEPRKYITTSNLYWNYFDFSKVGKMNFKKEELEKYTVKNGDLLVCEGGDFGRTAIWNYDEEVCFQNHIHRLRFFYQMDAKFFYWLFYLYKQSGFIKGKGIGIQGLSSGALHNIVFPIPPLAEQERIVKKVDELMARVVDLEQSADALASLKKAFPDDIKASLLQAAMQGKLTKQLPEDGNAGDLLEKIKAEKGKLHKKKKELPISEDEIPFEIPNSWCWQKLENISTFIGDKNNQIKESAVKKEGKYKVVSQSKELFIGYYDDERKLLKINHPVLVFGDHTALVKYIDFDFIIGADGVKVISPICMDVKYLYYALKYLLVGVNELGGYSRHYKFIKDKLVPIPPLTEQKRIAERLDTLMQNINVVGDLIASE